MFSSLISLFVRRLDGGQRRVEMRKRVCRSGVLGMFCLKSLYLSTCYTFSQSSGIPQVVSHLVCTAACRMQSGVPLCQLWRRAHPERAPIAKWSRYKKPWVMQLRKEASLLITGFRTAWPSLPPMCRQLSQRPLQIVQRAL